MKFAAAFALLAAVAAEELIEYDDSTLAGLSQDAREAALAELDQQAGVEEEMDNEENVMEQENAPENEDVEELDMEPLETEEVEAESDSDDASDSDEEVEVNADDEEEELSPSVAAKLEEGEEWGFKKLLHKAEKKVE